MTNLLLEFILDFGDSMRNGDAMDTDGVREPEPVEDVPDPDDWGSMWAGPSTDDDEFEDTGQDSEP